MIKEAKQFNALILEYLSRMEVRVKKWHSRRDITYNDRIGFCFESGKVILDMKRKYPFINEYTSIISKNFMTHIMKSELLKPLNPNFSEMKTSLDPYGYDRYFWWIPYSLSQRNTCGKDAPSIKVRLKALRILHDHYRKRTLFQKIRDYYFLRKKLNIKI